MAIRAVIFDCFGVLYRDQLSLLYDAVSPQRHAELKDIIHATDYGFLDKSEYYQAVADIAEISPQEVQQLDQQQHHRDEAMIAYVQDTRTRYKTALLSNVDSDTIHRLFTEEELRALFDEVIISGEVGMTKPSDAIYTLAATRLGLKPEECVMIDDIERNVEGAQHVGMQGVWFASRAQLAHELDRIAHA